MRNAPVRGAAPVNFMTTQPIKNLDEMTPREIVAELDKHVIGQDSAKRAVAVALRNRIRRRRLAPDLARDVLPKNILMIGSTGVGKTEIARRIARLAGSPFIKVEASKFTEVGYVGRDVEGMVRELADVAVQMCREEAAEDVRKAAEKAVEEVLLDCLLPRNPVPFFDNGSPEAEEAEAAAKSALRTREKLRDQLRAGELEGRVVEIETRDRSNAMIDFIGDQGMGDMGVNLQGMMGSLFPVKTVRRRATIAEARDFLLRDEIDSMVDNEQIAKRGLERVESSGIIFLDEIDKIAGRETGGHGPDVSRQGVQRDLLPLVEGTRVNTRHGMVSTDHILFIAAGAFHVATPSDLIPELQGRFPIRVELEPLSRDDMRRILTQPRNSLIKQYQALLSTEGISLEFTEDAVAEIAALAEQVNETTEDIGARRLHTLLERLLEEISFEGADLKEKNQLIDAVYVDRKLSPLVADETKRKSSL